jgi:hypothetical protein
MKRIAQTNEADAPKEPLFHYTKEKALFSIIDSNNFWLTSIYHMDDREELTFGFNVAHALMQAAAVKGDRAIRAFCEELLTQEDLEKIRTRVEFYSISFGMKDDGQQWACYADGGRGVALGLVPTFFHPLPIEESIFCGKVVYGDQQARARHSRAIEAAIEVIKCAGLAGSLRTGEDLAAFFYRMANEMMVEILWNCVTTKDSKWSHQHETRLLAFNNLQRQRLAIHSAPKRRVEIPQPLLKKSIVEVMVGPSADDAAEERVRKFLKAHSLSHVPVTRAR